MKFGLKLILNEISRWKKENVRQQSLVNNFKDFVDSGYFIHFTNNPQKLSFNPKSVQTNSVNNPLGLYAFPFTSEFVSQENHWSNTKFIALFKINQSSNILTVTNQDSSFVEKLKQMGSAKSSLYLKSKKIDGILSKDNSLSGDIKEELVIFNNDILQNVEIFPNSVRDSSKVNQLQDDYEYKHLMKLTNGNQKPERHQFDSQEDFNYSQEDYEKLNQKNQEINYYKQAERLKRK